MAMDGLLAKGYKLGTPTEYLIHDKGLDPYITDAQELLDLYGERIQYPTDFAIVNDGRKEIALEDLPAEKLLVDIGKKTMARYLEIINEAGTIFINGPLGIYEEPSSALGTECLFSAVVESSGYSVIGGGDSVAAAVRFEVRDQLSYVCTSGGGMVRFLSGQELPVVEALRRSARRHRRARAV